MIEGSKIKIRDKKLSDARNDYRWQTTPELVELDATPVLSASFPQYLLDYSNDLRHPSPARRLFAVETIEGEHIGNCLYYHIDEAKGEAELGIMIGNRDHWDKGYGTEVVTTLAAHIFRQTSLKRLYLKTLDLNQRAQKCFQKCGFTPYGHMANDGYSFLLMELHREQWAERQKGEEARRKG